MIEAVPVRHLRRVAVALSLLSSPAFGQPVYAVRPIPGFACAKLDVTEREALDIHGAVPIRTAPDPHAPVGTNASAVLFVRQPVHVENGYVEVLQLTAQPGWIEQRRVKPYDPLARCVPSILSNGRIGSG